MLCQNRLKFGQTFYSNNVYINWKRLINILVQCVVLNTPILRKQSLNNWVLSHSHTTAITELYSIQIAHIDFFMIWG